MHEHDFARLVKGSSLLHKAPMLPYDVLWRILAMKGVPPLIRGGRELEGGLKTGKWLQIQQLDSPVSSDMTEDSVKEE